MKRQRKLTKEKADAINRRRDAIDGPVEGGRTITVEYERERVLPGRGQSAVCLCQFRTGDVLACQIHGEGGGEE